MKIIKQEINTNNSILLKNINNLDSYKKLEYLEIIDNILKDFAIKFNFFDEIKDFIINPFTCDLNLIDSSTLKYELITIQQDINLKYKFLNETDYNIFFQKYIFHYPNIKKLYMELCTYFPTTYNNESFFSSMKYIKNSHKAGLKQKNLVILSQLKTNSHNLD